MKNIEVEIQVNVERIKPLQTFLDKEAKFISEEREIDEYYTPSHRNFAEKLPISEWLRIRNADGKYSINYKHWRRDNEGKTHHCHEYETGIDSDEQARNIFNVLDFKPVVRVDKIRKKYHFENYEITIDNVVGLEEAVEIEFKGETSKTPAQITEEMIKLLKDIGVGKMKRSYQGYAFLLMHPELAKFEEIS